MGVQASVEKSLTEPDDLTGRRVTVVDITGDDLGLMIGPRGETLDALQHLARLMVGHRIRQRANFVIDIDGYRERREQALSRLAERMGQKAIDRGTPVTLEPMPAYERRIIHMTLRENPQVRTESTGEGNRRRVRIYPI
jgi:spoIIIJ-associated protein